MKKYILIICSLLLVAVYSCNDTEEEQELRSVANSIYATFDDGSGFFNPEASTPYGDVITIAVPHYYPEESDNVSDITSMKLKANYPVTITYTDGTEVDMIDLTKETTIVITAANGTQTTHKVTGVIVKSPEAAIEEFRLPDANLDGYVIEDQKVVGLVPGGIDVSAQKPKLTLSPHTTISPDTSLVQDFSKPVVYTLTADDGTQVEYTVKKIQPNKVASGIRSSSVRLLWSKTLSEMGIDPSNHMSTSIALDNRYLVVNTRNVADRYFDRFSGKYIGDMEMGDIMSANLKNFFSTNDEAGNILITNLTTSLGQTLYISRWDSINDPTPQKYIEWNTTIAGQFGRKLSITGNLDEDAIIYMGVANTSIIAMWQVVDGTLLSQVPELITYSGSSWGLYCDVVSEGVTPSGDVFLSSLQRELVHLNFGTGVVDASLNLSSAGFKNNHSIDLKTFNNENYLAAINIKPAYSPTSGNGYLYNVTDPTAIADYTNALVYTTDDITGTANGNKSGDILLKVSPDGYKMIMYVFVTNGGVSAYEFDCIDIDNLL